MARRGWTRSVTFAILTAAGASATQLGLGYGLGIIAWVPTRVAATSDGAWSAGLAWTTWIAATSVVIGAVVGDRAGTSVDGGRFVKGAWRTVMALAATIGGLATVPLVAVPASAAQVVDNYAPHLLAAIYATVGVVLGLLISLVALASRPVTANVFASAGWLWTLAIIVVVDGSLSNRRLPYVQFAMWKFTDNGPTWHSYYIPGALLMLGAALLIGGLSAFPAAVRGESRVGIAVSGAAGPLIVAVAYIVASPKTGAPFEQLSAFYTAPYLVVAGLLGSGLVAAVSGIPARSSTRRRSKDSAPSRAGGKASVPTSSRADVEDWPMTLRTATTDAYE